MSNRHASRCPHKRSRALGPFRSPQPAIVLATGGHSNAFYLSTNAKNSNWRAIWRAHRRGALFANPCFTQIHPTCIPLRAKGTYKRRSVDQVFSSQASFLPQQTAAGVCYPAAQGCPARHRDSCGAPPQRARHRRWSIALPGHRIDVRSSRDLRDAAAAKLAWLVDSLLAIAAYLAGRCARVNRERRGPDTGAGSRSSASELLPASTYGNEGRRLAPRVQG